MELYQLHRVSKYMTECAEVLNEEWKRSLTARLHSLEKSCDSFPVCLVLLNKDTNTGGKIVIGHSKLSDVRGQKKKSCLVESVVVKKQYRGKGYGRIIMKQTEEFAVSKGYKTMYLTTHDKQDFYRHVGYEFCTPIVSMGCNILPDHLAEKLMGHMQLSDTPTVPTSSQNTKSTRSQDRAEPSTGLISNSLEMSAKTAKDECNPPAPPPPPPVTHQKVDGGGDKTVTRWDPKLVSWMKKDLVVL